MNFIDDVEKIWTKLWSVRLGIVSGLGAAIDAGYQVYIASPSRVTLIISIVVAVTSFGGVVARLIKQPALETSTPTPSE